MKSTLLFVTLLLLGACGGSSASSGSGQADILTVGYIAQGNNSSFIVKGKGWLEQEFPNTNIEWREFSTGADAVQAMASGAVDVGQAGSLPVVTAIAQGVPIEVVWVYDLIDTGEALAGRSDIKSVQDLAGKKVATPFGTTDHYSLLMALEEANVDPASLTILDMSPETIVGAYRQGDIDAAYTWAPGLTEILEDGRVIVTSGDMAEKGYPTYDLGVANPDFAAENPEIAARWVQLNDRAVELYRRDPAEAAEVIGAEFSEPARSIRSKLEGIIWINGEEQLARYMGTPDEPGKLAQDLENMAKVMNDQDQIGNVPASGEFVDAVNARYLEQALSRQ